MGLDDHKLSFRLITAEHRRMWSVGGSEPDLLWWITSNPMHTTVKGKKHVHVVVNHYY